MSLALLTDLYELTMAYGYWKLGRWEQRAAFHLYFRKAPFAGGYALAAGLQPALDFLREFQFETSDLDYLATLRGNDGQPLFSAEFLDFLGQLRLTCDVDAIPEGRVVFALEPLLRVRGPILECQILETALLNYINFQTLVATKAARLCVASRGAPVVEFGLRRAQGINGGMAASRAAYIGGCVSTSNVLAGKQYGIPVMGTHAHSWVMSFDDELEAFAEYAKAMPNNCVFLVDTYNTLEGVQKAVEIGRRLRQDGHEMIGIRLDSGDLAYLSIEARKILDAGGFPQASIVASNDLDEQIIDSLNSQGARIDVWGVGTKLATAYSEPALNGVYKLGALEDAAGNWKPKLKLSEQAIKTTIPGVLQVRRYETSQGFVADMIYEEGLGVDPRHRIVDAKDPTRSKRMPRNAKHYDLLQPVVRAGQVIAEPEPLADIRQRAITELQRLHPSVVRLLYPHEYPVGLDIGLHELRFRMIREARRQTESASE